MRRYQLSEDVATEPCAARGDDASGGFRVTTQTLEQFRVAKIGGGTMCAVMDSPKKVQETPIFLASSIERFLCKMQGD